MVCYLAFKVDPSGGPASVSTPVGDEETFEVYEIGDDYSVTQHKVARKARTCTCPIHRLEGTCPHLQMVLVDPKYFFSPGSDDFRDTHDSTYWLTVPVIMIPGQIEPAFIDYKLSDVSAVQLIRSCRTNSIIPPGPKPGGIRLERLYEELNLVFKARTTLTGEEPVDTDPVTEAVKNRIETPSKPKPEWMKVEKPNPEEFFVEDDVWDQICYSLWFGENLLLIGPSGSGKTAIMYLAAKAMGRPLVAFNMGAMSEPRTSLIGNTHFKKAEGTFFEKSRFVRAVSGDMGAAVVLQDEITRADLAALNILLPLLDDQGYLALDESEDSAVIYRHKDVAFAATANIGMEYTGTTAMDTALKGRFATVIDMFFPPPNNEIAVLVGRCEGLSRKDATRLVNLADKQRNMTKEGEFTDMISTRLLLKAGDKIGRGMSFEAACTFSIENHFTTEGQEGSDRAKIRQIIQKGGRE